MASLIRAVKSAAGDNFWLPKLIIAVYAVYFIDDYIMKSGFGSGPELTSYIVLGIVFFGCAVTAMHRNINNKCPLFPGIKDIGEAAAKAACGIISILPGAVSAAAVFYFFNSVQMEPVNRWLLNILAVLILSPFIIMPLVLYTARGRIADAYRFDMINKTAGNFMTSFAGFIIQFAFIYGLCYAVLYYFLVQMFGEVHIIIKILQYTAAVIGFFTSMIYFSDLYDDSIPAFEDEEE